MLTATRTPHDSDRSASAPTVIAPGSVIEGDLVCSDEIHISGDLVGDVKAKRLILTGTGSVKGSIAADLIELGGYFEGKVSGRDVNLSASARGNGVIHATESLRVEPGAAFEGQVKRIRKRQGAQNGAAKANSGTAAEAVSSVSATAQKA